MKVEGRFFTLEKSEGILSWETYFHQEATGKIKRKSIRNIVLALLFLIIVFAMNQVHILLYLFYLFAHIPVYVGFRQFSRYLGIKPTRKMILEQSDQLEPVDGFPETKKPWILVILVWLNYFLWAYVVQSNMAVEQTARQQLTWFLIPLLVLFPIAYALKELTSIYGWVHRGSLSEKILTMEGHFYYDFDERIYLDPDVYQIGWYHEELDDPIEDKLIIYYMSSFRRYTMGYFPYTNLREYQQLLQIFSEMADQIGIPFVKVKSLMELPGPARMI